MARVNKVYDLPGSAHNQSTTADGTTVRTVTAATGAVAAWITVRTNGIFMTFDGTTPSATNGLELPSGSAPWLYLLDKTIKWVSQAAGGSTVNVCWLD